jgi:hypothetical protein
VHPVYPEMKIGGKLGMGAVSGTNLSGHMWRANLNRCEDRL